MLSLATEMNSEVQNEWKGVEECFRSIFTCSKYFLQSLQVIPTSMQSLYAIIGRVSDNFNFNN